MRRHRGQVREMRTDKMDMWTADEVPFFKFVGVERARVEDEVGIAEIDWRPETSNSSGRMHGGAIAAVVNAAMIAVLRQEIGDRQAILVQMSISHLSSGRDRVVARARIARSGTTTVFVTCEVSQSGSGKMMATASAIFQSRSKE